MNSTEELFAEFKTQISSAVSTIDSAELIHPESDPKSYSQSYSYFDGKTAKPNSVCVQFSGAVNTDPIQEELSPSLRKLCMLHIEEEDDTKHNTFPTNRKPVNTKHVYFRIHPASLQSLTEDQPHISFTGEVAGQQRELLVKQLSDYEAIVREVYPNLSSDQLYTINNDKPDNFRISVKKCALLLDHPNQNPLTRLPLTNFLSEMVSIVSVSESAIDSESVELTIRSVYSSFENVAQVNSPVLRQRGTLLKEGLKFGTFTCPNCESGSLRNLYRYTYYCTNCYNTFSHNTMSLPKFVQSESFKDMKQTVTEEVQELQGESDTVPIPETDITFTLDSGTDGRVYLYGKDETATAVPGRTDTLGPVLMLLRHNIGIPYSFATDELLLEKTIYSGDTDSTYCVLCMYNFSAQEPIYSGPFTIDVSETHQLQLSHKALFCESCVESLQDDVAMSLEQIPTEDVFSYMI